MIVTSRNPQEFLERVGLSSLKAQPMPRLPIQQLLIHTLPLEKPLPLQSVLLEQEGEPTPPDRGSARPWPNQL